MVKRHMRFKSHSYSIRLGNYYKCPGDSARNKTHVVLAVQELEPSEMDRNHIGKSIITGYDGGKIHSAVRVGYRDLGCSKCE